ncbi:MAG: hypothetical protein LBC63_03845 [Holophagales bacterium]|jgi:hypothetical protein|nr:hypothetical protein [Holophagales bacterium]
MSKSEVSVCPICKGKGIVVDKDPDSPARVCDCSKKNRSKVHSPKVPQRYDVTKKQFYSWWERHFSDERVTKWLDDAQALLDNEASRESIPLDLQNKIAGIISKCVGRGENERGWKTISPAQEPYGYSALMTWLKKSGRDKDICLWWISGPPGSGKSSLAAVALKEWCEGTQLAGIFTLVKTLSQELKDTYYDTRSWQNTDFMSERDRMAPLLSAPCLVLDDFDMIDTDTRVLRAFSQLIDFRHSELLPTIVTASKSVETLQAEGEAFPMMKLNDESMMNRLCQARRVELVPTLQRLMGSLLH